MATSTLRRQGPRERMLAHGPACLTTPELLGIVLRTGTRGLNAVELGQMLLDHFNGLKGLLSADASALRQLAGIGPAKCTELLVIRELHRRCALETLTGQPVLDQADKVREYCLAHIGHLPVEHCLALFLDNQLRLICAEEISTGTINQASVYPREILRAAIRHHSCAIILAHNHPSGAAHPSASDIRLTRHIRQALALVDIRLLDHIIVTPTQTVSMAERGDL